MASRIKVIKSLKELGIKPKHKKYGEFVTQILMKKFKVDSDVSEKNESLVKNVAGAFARKVKMFYVECGYKFKYLLKKKQDWLSGLIKNPLPEPKSVAPKTKKGRPKKKKRGPPVQDYSDLTPGGSQQSATASKLIGKVIYPKYSKYYLSTVAHTMCAGKY